MKEWRLRLPFHPASCCTAKLCRTNLPRPPAQRRTYFAASFQSLGGNEFAATVDSRVGIGDV